MTDAPLRNVVCSIAIVQKVMVEVRPLGTLEEALPYLYTPRPITALTPYLQHAQ